MNQVSVIIPTFNRFDYLLNTIRSIKDQTYKNIEIIVINDHSTQSEYYNYDWSMNNVNIIHLEKNSKEIFGYPCIGYVRNQGIEIAKGKYIAFCDDDDIWFPNKIDLQIIAMNNSECKMSCTDGLIGNGMYNANNIYKKYNAEHYYKTLVNIYKNKENMLGNGFPDIWTPEFLKIHNCVINSSVILEKDLLITCGMVPYDRRGQDYACWLKVINFTNIIYLKDICFYYDLNHGNGSNH